MSDVQEIARDPQTGVFLQGKSGNPAGRGKGSRNKLSELLFDDLHEAWKERGMEAITAMIDKKPGDFVKVVASLMPKEFSLKAPLQELSDDEVWELIGQIRRVTLESARDEPDCGDDPAHAHKQIEHAISE